MKFDEINPQQSQEILDEVKMSTSVFDQFINSSEADGIKAGFEAELIFRGLGEASYDEDPEMDDSPDRSPRSIDDIFEFFYDGEYNGRRSAERLRENLQEEFSEWQNEQLSEAWSEVELEKVEEFLIEENYFDLDEEITNYLIDTLELNEEQVKAALLVGQQASEITSSKQLSLFAEDNEAFAHYTEARDAADELLKERVQECVDSQDRNYYRAREEWEDEARDDYDESEWLDESPYDSMMDVYRQTDINWPYWTEAESSEGGYSVENATRLARRLENAIGVTTKVASGYHSTTRKPGLWIFEPDSSLDPDDDEDMPVEIISPPMPLKECLSILPDFYDWAATEDAYSNDSTGFHIGVSLPDVGGRVDYVKLALFLGDQYVLDKFERSSNYFAKSAMQKIRDEVTSGKLDPSKITDVLDKMKNNMLDLANSTISSGRGLGHGHGKYTSINMKGDYIEFRSMGSESYFSNPESLKNVIDTIKRYAYAMYISSQPNLYREEYAKKLYKLLDREGNNAEAMREFSNYVAAVGGADAQTVKNFIRLFAGKSTGPAALPDRKIAAKPNAPANDTASQAFGNWVILMNGVQVFRVSASDQGEANSKARAWINNRSPEFKAEHAGQEVEVVPYRQ